MELIHCITNCHSNQNPEDQVPKAASNQLLSMKTAATFDVDDSFEIDASADLSLGIDISLPICFDTVKTTEAFGLPHPKQGPVEFNQCPPCEPIKLSVACGCPVNVDDLRFNVHGSTTHCESVRHILHPQHPAHKEEQYVPLPGFFPAAVVRIPQQRSLGQVPDKYKGEQQEENDEVICREDLLDGITKLEKKFKFSHGDAKFCEALIIAYDSCAHQTVWTDTNPPYPSTDAIGFILEYFPNVRHLLINLPSIDREQDGGTTPNHRLFFGVENIEDKEATYPQRFVTELIFTPETVESGFYLLNMHVANIRDTDAVPARPILYKISELTKRKSKSKKRMPE